MGKIKVDQIEIESANSIQLNNPIKIKSYDAAGISALTPVSGDLIYDSDNSKLKVYDGSAWQLVGGADFSAVGENIIPSADVTYDLGSNSYKWRDLYLSGSSIYLGDQTITSDSTSISLSGSLKLKQYTTAQIDALTGESDGEMVYDTNKKQVAIFNGSDSEWNYANQSGSLTATGGTISQYTSGGAVYKVHTFTSSGTFSVTSGRATIEWFGVAGGGGGGGSHGGGGGAGGAKIGSQEVSAGTYTITIGSGGAGSPGLGSAASSGGNTELFGTTLTGGGRGGTRITNNSVHAGGNGGSGGGGAGTNPTTAGTGTSGEGNDGGAGSSDSTAGHGGGGGGASSAGTAASGAENSGFAGNGGDGISNDYQTGSTQVYAGGGGGGTWGSATAGTGGTGGGGNGVNVGNTNANNATGYGSGGGGCSGGSATGGSGSGGIVIIRYS